MKKYLQPQDIIQMNLELQTVQRGLHQLGVYKPSLNLITSNSFLNNFQVWDEKRKETFTRLISGGNIYYKTIKNFLVKKNHEITV